MTSEQTPLPPPTTNTAEAPNRRALRMVTEILLDPDVHPTAEEAEAIMTEAVGRIAVGDVRGQVGLVTYPEGEQQPLGIVNLPFPEGGDPASRNRLQPLERAKVVAVQCDLSEREADALRRAAQGSSNYEIGKALNLSEDRVKACMGYAYEKLNATDRAHAVMILYGIIPRPKKRFLKPG